MDLNGTKLLAAVEFAPGNTRGRGGEGREDGGGGGEGGTSDTLDTLAMEVVADIFWFCFGPIRAFIETEQQQKKRSKENFFCMPV